MLCSFISPLTGHRVGFTFKNSEMAGGVLGLLKVCVCKCVRGGLVYTCVCALVSGGKVTCVHKGGFMSVTSGVGGEVGVPGVLGQLLVRLPGPN